MPASRATLRARLRRARTVVGTAIVVVTAGLTAAVAGVIPGREPDPAPAVDPFSERLTAFPPVGATPGPTATSSAPVAVSGAS